MSVLTHPRRWTVGSTTERNAYTPASGAYGEGFWDTDEKAIYLWDGTAWSRAGAGVVAKFGGASDYSQFGIDGTLTQYGLATTFDDVLPNSVTVGPGASSPSFTAYNGNLRAYEFNSGPAKNLQMQFQIPHSYKLESTVYPHLHLYVPNDASGGVVKFTCEFTWTNIGDVEGATSTYYGTLSVPASDGNRHKILPINSTAFIGTGKGISSILSCVFQRDVADAADTYPLSVWLKGSDVHVENDSLGSKEEYIK